MGNRFVADMLGLSRMWTALLKLIDQKSDLTEYPSNAHADLFKEIGAIEYKILVVDLSAKYYLVSQPCDWCHTSVGNCYEV